MKGRVKQPKLDTDMAKLKEDAGGGLRGRAARSDAEPGLRSALGR